MSLDWKELRKREHEIRAQQLANPEQFHLPIKKKEISDEAVWSPTAIGWIGKITDSIPQDFHYRHIRIILRKSWLFMPI